jgi:drug/metabolite transporter (DMT)-like permease
VGDNSRAAGAAAITVVLWASAFVAIRSAGGHFSPGALAFGRLLVASLALGVMWLISGDGWPQKPALGHASAVQVTTFGCFVGTAACLPFAGQLVSELGSAPASATLNVVYLGLFPTMLGFTTWAYALARTTSGKMGATTYAIPGLVVLMSWLILGQVPRWLTIAGGALCLAGVAGRGGRRRPAPLRCSPTLTAWMPRSCRCDTRPTWLVGAADSGLASLFGASALKEHSRDR